MARLPRIVIPGYPHHVTQRGNRRARTLFEDGDFATFLAQEDVAEAFKRLYPKNLS
jgi:REP element-mobilizing transposase RayT